jgi:2-polyprenyl-3-methyl-5-hydroxy-6-metoxy-1,4-benzoquinol methylase
MSLETLTRCPLCSGSTFDPHLQVKDQTVSHGTFHIVRCKKCDFLFTNPRPSEEEISKYYDSENYISHHDEPTSLFANVYQQVRNIAARDKLKLLNRYDVHAEKQILDVGCGTGFFLSTCKAKGWGITGTEPDPDARSVAAERTQSPIYASLFDDALAPRQFTSITLWHVLEHVHRLNETLDWIHQHLAPKGTLFVAVPNPESHDAQVFGTHWAAYDVPRHLYHFTKDTISRLVQHHNFTVVDAKSMLFDAYYVSLLSNQYKTGSRKLIDSFLTGTLSNLKGYGTTVKNTNASSIIYVIRKK